MTSLPGLAILKLFAWDDRGAGNSKDAHDLLTLFRHYANAGNQDRLYEEAIDVLKSVDYDVDLAGPQLLGKDVRAIAAAATHEQIVNLLGDTKQTDKLVTHMAAALRGVEDQIGTAERLLEQFKTGISKD